MSARSVVVVMPFGGVKSRDPRLPDADEREVARRRAILNFKRLEYIVRNKCKVTPASVAGGAADAASDAVVYGVQVIRAASDPIPDRALRQIDTADILIALVLAEPNPNVIYEVAYRRARDRTIVLVADSREDLPLYLGDWPCHPWSQPDVLARIDRIATDPDRIPDLPDFTVGIPTDLKELIDRHDGVLAAGVQKALQDIEATFVPGPGPAVRYLRGIVSDEMVSFYPSSIVEVTFAGPGQFDPQHPPIVDEFDDGFSRLYGYGGKAAAEADRPLTLDKLLKRIEAFSEPKDWKQFTENQTELTEVLRTKGFARASVPLRINDKHSRAEYCGASYLPCVVAQVIDGNAQAAHKMFLLIICVEMPREIR